MSTYDTLTRAEIQEFQKAKVLNEKIGRKHCNQYGEKPFAAEYRGKPFAAEWKS